MKRLPLLIIGAFSLSTAALGAPFIVTNTADTGVGSLRQAIISANTTAGADTISFTIPASDPNCNATTNVCTITPASALPTITEAVTINGYSQPGSSANTQTTGTNAVLVIQLDGGSFGFSFNGLTVQAANCVIRGLVITRFSESVNFSGSLVTGNSVEGCFIGPAPDGATAPPGNSFAVTLSGGANNNIIGGTALSARNLISGHPSQFCITIRDAGTDNNQVLNNLIGTTRTGNAALSNGGGIAILSGAKNNHIGSSAAGAGNVISANNYDIRLASPGTSGNVIEGNFIGTNAAGTASLGSTTAAGIDLFSNPSGNIIGGATSGSRNVISGNSDGIDIAGNDNSVLGNFIGTDITGTIALPNRNSGVEVRGSTGNNISGNVIAANGAQGVVLNGNFGPTSGNQITANRIGVGLGGEALGNGFQGIFLGNSNAFNNKIGGVGAGEGNIIANNGQGGVGFGTGAGVPNNGNAILGNSIYNNTGLGIVMPTVNDPCDTDGGPNNGQNFPVLTSVNSSSSSTQIAGTFNSTSNTAFRVEFFANPACDDSGFGEGKTFIGATVVTTDASCNATINFIAPVGNLSGQSISATATDPQNNTSGFSACLVVAGSPAQLLNISTRLKVISGQDSLGIGGFIITGTGPKKVIIRGIGPTLTNFSLQNVLADPTLALHTTNSMGQDVVLATNDNWKIDDQTQQSQEATVRATGLPPSNDAESAIVATLSPGAYTAQLRGKNGGTGIGLVEIYDLAPNVGSALANISTRGFVDTGDIVMIGGFILGTSGSNNATVVVRAIGPSMQAMVTGTLSDPNVSLHDQNGTMIAFNDDWQQDGESNQIPDNLKPSDTREGALHRTLVPGNYTAIVRGKGNTTGIALVEVYNLP